MNYSNTCRPQVSLNQCAGATPHNWAPFSTHDAYVLNLSINHIVRLAPAPTPRVGGSRFVNPATILSVQMRIRMYPHNL